ncbi:hypothetical protein PoB_006954300 [Plakobranchus ocellatus]|uniref:Uncharacterized protein n=1 Tax=Plakobranchus ocellatus TaxID=259542 RepID=A0AAV4DFH9_9GAST|nr:hypothetical protein PoB_006954300 [Plakobranchus ocellatus]
MCFQSWPAGRVFPWTRRQDLQRHNLHPQVSQHPGQAKHHRQICRVLINIICSLSTPFVSVSQIYAGPYSNYGNNVIVDCCVIGYGLPRAGTAAPQAPSRQTGTGLFGNTGLLMPGANTNFNNNNLNSRNTISDDKFQLIGGYGNSRAFGDNSANTSPQLGFQTSPRQGSSTANTQGVYGSNPFYSGAGRQNTFNIGPGGRPSYDNIYNRGNTNYNTNRLPIAGAVPDTGSANSNNGQTPGSQNYYSGAGGNLGTGRNNGYSPSSSARSSGGGSRGGFSNSQFPSVFSNIGSPDFFKLDGELAGAAFVTGGPEVATGIGSAGKGTGGDATLSSSLAGGFKPPQGPSFQDIYNKPTGESPLSGLGFSDTVSPERRNSISDIFFSDGNVKDTIGLSKEDMFIPRENEESESSSSYQSDSGDYPDGEGDDYYNDNDIILDNDNDSRYDDYDIVNSDREPYDSVEANYSQDGSSRSDPSFGSDETSTLTDPSPLTSEGVDNQPEVEVKAEVSSGPKPIYRSASQGQ